MTNYDFYKDKITDAKFAVVNGKPRECSIVTPCNNCLFCECEGCDEPRLEWLKAEYVEPKPKRTIDIDDFCLYLETEINNLETLETNEADNGNYVGAIGRRAYANAFHEILGLITLDNPPKWIKEVEE